MRIDFCKTTLRILSVRYTFSPSICATIWVTLDAVYVYDSHYQSTLDAVYVYVVPWSEIPIVPSYPHYPLIRDLTQLVTSDYQLDKKAGNKVLQDATPAAAEWVACAVALGWISFGRVFMMNARAQRK